MATRSRCLADGHLYFLAGGNSLKNKIQGALASKVSWLWPVSVPEYITMAHRERGPLGEKSSSKFTHEDRIDGLIAIVLYQDSPSFPWTLVSTVPGYTFPCNYPVWQLPIGFHPAVTGPWPSKHAIDLTTGVALGLWYCASAVGRERGSVLGTKLQRW